MRVVFFILLFVVTITDSANAQTPLGEEGNQFSLSSGYSLNGIPINIAYEMGLFKKITFGMEGTYRMFHESTDSIPLDHTIVGFSFFGNYYLNELLNIDDKWYVYAGLNLGYFKWFSPDNYLAVGKSSSTLAIGAQVGGRYYFDKWGIFLEIAASSENAGAKLGVSYRYQY